MHRFAALFLLLGLIPGAAQATQQGIVAAKKWQSMDECAKLAQAAFPDSTPEALAKRDASLNDCLAKRNLPPRAPLAPPAPPARN